MYTVEYQLKQLHQVGVECLEQVQYKVEYYAENVLKV